MHVFAKVSACIWMNAAIIAIVEMIERILVPMRLHLARVTCCKNQIIPPISAAFIQPKSLTCFYTLQLTEHKENTREASTILPAAASHNAQNAIFQQQTNSNYDSP